MSNSAGNIRYTTGCDSTSTSRATVHGPHGEFAYPVPQELEILSVGESAALRSEATERRNRRNAAWLRSGLMQLAAELARVSAYELTPPSTEDLRRRLIAIVEGRVG